MKFKKQKPQNLSVPSSKSTKLPKSVKWQFSNPINLLEYPQKCCCCVPLRIGVILICIFTFIWALLELSRSDRRMATIFPNKEVAYTCFKSIHLFIIIAYLAFCGVLLYGIFQDKFKLITMYVWAALIFNSICVVVLIAWLAAQVSKTGGLTRKVILQLMLHVIWYTIFFYYISVVNSYKFRVLANSVFKM